MRDESSTELPGVGDVIGNWRIIGFLGDGRSGIVFKVRERNGTERIGALKLFKGPFRRRHHRAFAHEIGIVERQIVPGFMPALYGRGRWRRRPFFVMQLVDAIPGELSTRHARRIMDGAASALGQLHARHYLHCDVKPENLGLVNGRVVLLDFGSARPFADADKSPNRVGTWALMAPEVREKLRLDVRSDIYSLGATLNRICSHTARRTFDDLILRATTNNPDDRPQTIEEFRRELNTAQDRLARFKIVGKRVGRTFVAFMMVMVLFCGLRYILTLIRDQETIQNNTDFETARECHRRGDYTNEVRHLLPVATSNSRWKRQACRILANRYRKGQGVERDLEKSRAFHDEANKGESQ